jgi:acyl-CoA thioester hydrolase
MNIKEFSRTYDVKWSEVDPNGHMRHTAYGDYAVDVRFRFLADNGFHLAKIREIGMGPVILREENRYLKEVVMGDAITINIKLGGISEDGSHWIFQHEILKSNGKKAAVLLVEGGWLDLIRRKLVKPPLEFQNLANEMDRTEEFTELSSYMR